MVLALNKITRFHGTRLIFKDVSLKISAGTVTLLVGANGAGKSTLLHIIANLMQPTSGTVTYADSPDFTLGYLGHHTFLYPELTALENLMFWQKIYGRKNSAQDFTNALEQVNLLPFAHEKTKVFSRGMAQRLNLARVFLLQPTLLLLDEPATGLDTKSTTVLHNTIQRAKIDGCAVIWVTHAIEQDANNADFIAHIENKKLGYFGPICDFFALAQKTNLSDEPVNDSSTKRVAL